MLPKRASDSAVTLTQLMQPEHANAMGNVHGGVLMRLIDEAGALCAMRHARRQAVTVAVDSLSFLKPVHIGDLVILSSRLTYVGHTSMEVEVRVESEKIHTGTRELTNVAYAVYVALDENGNPVPVPPLHLETAEERAAYEQGRDRQIRRLAAKNEARLGHAGGSASCRP